MGFRQADPNPLQLSITKVYVLSVSQETPSPLSRHHFYSLLITCGLEKLQRLVGKHAEVDPFKLRNPHGVTRHTLKQG